MPPPANTTDAALAARFARCATPDLADALRRQGVWKAVIKGPKPLNPIAGSVAGRARTLRTLPDREDVKDGPHGAVNRKLYDSIGAGEVLVVDAMSYVDGASLGDMMFSRLIARGVAAVIIDGAARDIPVVADKGMPILALATTPAAFFGFLRPWETDVDIQCGGVLVRPGDWIVADAEGAVVVPAALAEAVLDDAEKRRADDAFSAALLAAGHALEDSYPLPAHQRPHLAAFQASGALPPVKKG